MKSQIIPVKLDKGGYCFAYVSIKSFTVAGTEVFEKSRNVPKFNVPFSANVEFFFYTF